MPDAAIRRHIDVPHGLDMAAALRSAADREQEQEPYNGSSSSFAAWPELKARAVVVPRRAFIAVDGLTLGYGRRLPALEDVSFESRSGVTLLLGANGVGKSTLVAAVARAHRPRVVVGT